MLRQNASRLETVLNRRHSGSRFDCDRRPFPVLIPASTLFWTHPRSIIPRPAAGQFPRSWRKTDIMRNRTQDSFLFLDVHGCHASYSLKTVLIITSHKREVSALFAGTCSSPDPMEVDQCLMWKVVIQDMTHSEDIQSSSGYIGRHKYRGIASTE